MLAKGLSGGMVPLGAMIFSERCESVYFWLKHSSTFAGNTLACRVGQATLNLLKEQQHHLDEISRIGSKFMTNLPAAQLPLLRQVRGAGYLIGLDFAAKQTVFASQTFMLGVFHKQSFLSAFVASYLLNVHHIRVQATLNRASTLRVEPSLIATEQMFDQTERAVVETCTSAAQHGTVRLLAHVLGFKGEFPRNQESVEQAPLDLSQPFYLYVATIRKPENFAVLDSSFSVLDDAGFEKLAEIANELIETFVLFEINQGARAIVLCAPSTDEQAQEKVELEHELMQHGNCAGIAFA